MTTPRYLYDVTRGSAFSDSSNVAPASLADLLPRPHNITADLLTPTFQRILTFLAHRPAIRNAFFSILALVANSVRSSTYPMHGTNIV